MHFRWNNGSLTAGPTGHWVIVSGGHTSFINHHHPLVILQIYNQPTLTPPCLPPSAPPSMAIRIRNPAPLSLILFFYFLSILLFSAASSSPDPIRARADLLRKQLTDLSSVSSLYASSSRKLSLETSKQSRLFTQLSQNFSILLSSNPPQDASRFERDARALISSARALISASKDSFDPQIKIQRLKDAIFAANEQLTKVDNCRDSFLLDSRAF